MNYGYKFLIAGIIMVLIGLMVTAFLPSLGAVGVFLTWIGPIVAFVGLGMALVIFLVDLFK